MDASQPIVVVLTGVLALIGVIITVMTNGSNNRANRRQEDKRAEERERAADRRAAEAQAALDKDRAATTERLRLQLDAGKESDLRTKRIEAYADAGRIAANVLRARESDLAWAGVKEFTSARSLVLLLAMPPVRDAVEDLQKATAEYAKVVWAVQHPEESNLSAQEQCKAAHANLSATVQRFREAAAMEIGV